MLRGETLLIAIDHAPWMLDHPMVMLQPDNHINNQCGETGCGRLQPPRHVKLRFGDVDDRDDFHIGQSISLESAEAAAVPSDAIANGAPPSGHHVWISRLDWRPRPGAVRQTEADISYYLAMTSLAGLARRN